jgi:hypothetical protein
MLATVAVCVLVFCACIARESDARQVHGWDASLPKPHSTFELGHHPRQRHPLHKQLQAHQNPYSRYSSAHSRGLAATPEILPLYPGYGTHFAYIYVGTPPQRQSVIIDTGSHYTAFPCVGCAQCGQHTDSYWDPNNSTTKDIPLVITPSVPSRSRIRRAPPGTRTKSKIRCGWAGLPPQKCPTQRL